ncbi:hypothetical protein Fleli_0732 [Bernardetia litoralis DSM 6794]|uniref:Protein-glutamine gamma-glutamyltransferase-like C-terminal domain-containing protein n=1 Tax=Bernardetia litoralis (strain ATCC 23117 / DSM 6794 / NBRC 15988 / NCIMB 1366 / Fx l1 / Sio-4) TaxID=880071 RepID=I4AGV7_BERLS|nr:DUF4129 domain-containing protein [Bernardetia litoralis]AFM03192.1 hypothetical protein Fleli_0732 [Bernardetia litoralis DSM 6794]
MKTTFKRTIFSLLIVLTFLVGSNFSISYAQDKTTQQETEVITVKEFDEKKWNELRDGIKYADEVEKKKKDTAAPNLPSMDWSFLAGFKYVFIGLVVALLALALVWFFTKGVLFGNKKTKLEEEQAAFLTEENLEKVEFGYLEQSLEKALLQRNFRMAIRIHYLWLLKVLYEKELINWKKDKTNHAYISELARQSSQESANNFRKLTLWYEKAWYGESKIDEKDFRVVEKDFIAFKKEYENKAA